MESTLKILCLEDSVEDFGLIQYHLRRAGIAGDIQRVETREEFQQALQNTHVDLVLSDHSLPQFDSLEALKIVRSNFPVLPFILVTGAVSE